MVYRISDEYYFRLHHPRPRFKNDVENVLIFMATEISRIEPAYKNQFNQRLDSAIRNYPGNRERVPKTIFNWRTEISTLFSLIEKREDLYKPSRRAIELSENQDLVRFFKIFVYFFSYPGGVVKPEKNNEFIQAGVNFRPGKYITEMLLSAENEFGHRAGIDKAEATHIIFNDLRVTRDNQNILETWERIIDNRNHNIEYDWSSDVIRYAGDFLDYMVLANILVQRPNGKYYLNRTEDLAIQRIINPTHTFSYYDRIIDSDNIELSEIREIDNDWRNYFNTEINEGFFDTDALALFTQDEDEYNHLIEAIEEFRVTESPTTRIIGDLGEGIIMTHEKNRIIIEGRPDLVHLITKIPNALALGYDINSIDISETRRQIEVKTTASRNRIDFNRFHLTPNEWRAARSYRDSYYVYRLLISRESMRLFLMQNPYQKLLEERITTIPGDGMDVIFNPAECGDFISVIIEREN